MDTFIEWKLRARLRVGVETVSINDIKVFPKWNLEDHKTIPVFSILVLDPAELDELD